VTVVPTGTEIVPGWKEKLAMVTLSCPIVMDGMPPIDGPPTETLFPLDGIEGIVGIVGIVSCEPPIEPPPDEG
jgi:hypothetical protein